MIWRRQHEQEREAAAAYEREGMSALSVPRVFYGYVGGREVLHVLVSREEWSPGDDRWHVSVSAEGRVPTWEELSTAAHELRPGVGFVVSVPPRSWWVNVHPHVLHLTECKDQGLIDQWRVNARGDTPS